MSSLRHKDYLDAARECLLDLGWKRTTLTEVARRCGVSRMTLYRAFPDMDGLLGDLMTREWAALATAAVEEVDPALPAPEQISAGVLAVLRGLRTNELFRRILDVDPELVLPYLFVRRGRSQDAILTLLAEQVTAGQAAGRLRDGDPATIARSILLAAHGFGLSLHTMTDSEVTEEALDALLADFLTKGLRP